MSVAERTDMMRREREAAELRLGDLASGVMGAAGSRGGVRKSFVLGTMAAGALGAALLLAVSAWHQPRLAADQLTGSRLGEAMAAKLSVTDAVGIAERLMGGEVLEASYALLPRRPGPAYAVRTYRQGVLWEAKIDANSGRIVGTKAMIPDKALPAEEKAEVESLASSATSIVQAIRIAERQTKGKAVSADLERLDTGVFWEVIVVADGRSRKLLIDPALAKRPAHEGALRGAPVSESL